MMNSLEQMKKDVRDYLKIVAIVYSIDKEAANYLLTEALLLPEFRFRDDLGTCFLWETTPYGRDYWYDLCEEIYKIQNHDYRQPSY